MRWQEHVARVTEMRKTQSSTGNPKMKKPPETPRRRCENSVEKDVLRNWGMSLDHI
jgi:hypothetical protein